MIDIEGFREKLYDDEMSLNTIRSYVFAVQQYAQEYSDITKENLRTHKEKLKLRCKPSTVNLRLTALLSYCRYIGKPMQIKKIKTQRQTYIENVITREQHDLLIRRLRSDGLDFWAVNVALLSMTGMRISEAVRVTKRDVLAGSVTLSTKGKIRTILIPATLRDAIAQDLEQLHDRDLIMRSSYGRPISAGYVSEGLKRYGCRYGIPKEVLHPHSFRHFFAIEYLKNDNNIAKLCDLLGHGSIEMTKIYLQQSQAQQKAAVDAAVNWYPGGIQITCDNQHYHRSEKSKPDENDENKSKTG